MDQWDDLGRSSLGGDGEAEDKRGDRAQDELAPPLK